MMLIKLVRTYDSCNKHPPDTDDTDSSVVVKSNVNRVLNIIYKKYLFKKSKIIFQVQNVGRITAIIGNRFDCVRSEKT